MRKPLLVLGIAAFVLSSIFVPYEIEYRTTTAEVVGTSGEKQTVYRIIGSPPELGFHDDEESPFGTSGDIHDAEVNTGRLMIQYAVILAIFGGGALIAGGNSEDEE